MVSRGEGHVPEDRPLDGDKTAEGAAMTDSAGMV